MQQEAQLNAPDPRESRPPCYEEALRMPKYTFWKYEIVKVIYLFYFVDWIDIL
jgi:hypothetical protein